MSSSNVEVLDERVKSENQSRPGDGNGEEKLRVLISVCGFPPATKYGGPAVSLDSLTQHLKAFMDCFVLTGACDLGSKERLPGILSGWNQKNGVFVRYLDDDERTLENIRAVFDEVRPHVVYVNSIFFAALFIPMVKVAHERQIPLVVAPRGELCAGAFSNGKRWKKIPYLLALGPWLRNPRIFWHATSEEESAQIQRRLGIVGNIYLGASWRPLETPPPTTHHQEVQEASEGETGRTLNREIQRERDLKVGGAIDQKIHRGDLDHSKEVARIFQVIETPEFPNRAIIQREKSVRRKLPGELNIAFISRICPKKNLHVAIQSLNGVQGNVTLDVMGPIEDAAYWEVCQRAMVNLPPNIRVNYLGQVSHDDVYLAFAKHDLFLFPTRSENFGHVVAEAISADCPVAISRGTTPWDDLESTGVGRCFSLNDPTEITSVIQEFADMDESAYAALVSRQLPYLKNKLRLNETIADYVAMFRQAAFRHSKNV